MNLVDFLKEAAISGLKITFEYNYDYNCHVVTASIDELESKTLISMNATDLEPPYSGYISRDIRRMIQRVTDEKQRRMTNHDQCE